jgi:hypothetical protein
MMHILKKIHNLLHSIMKLILRRGRIERDDSILIVSLGRVVAADDSSTCRPGPILNPQTIRHKRIRVHRKVGHLILKRRRGGLTAMVCSLRGGMLRVRGGVFCSRSLIWGRNTVGVRPLEFT